ELTRGSCYAPLRYDEALRAVVRRNETCAVTGVPCVLRGMERLPTAFRSRIRFKIGLVCSHNVTGQFVDWLAKRHGISTDEPFLANLRDKHGGIKDANNFNTYFRLHDREIRVNRFESGFTEAWRGYLFAQESCLYCPDFYAADADLSAKDAWGRLSQDPLGISLLTVRNSPLKELLLDLNRQGSLHVEPCDVNEIEHSQIVTARFKQCDVWHRWAWKTPIRRALIKQGFGHKFSGQWTSAASQHYWMYRFNLVVSRWLYSVLGTVPVRTILAPGSATSRARNLLRSLLRLPGRYRRRFLGLIAPMRRRLGRLARVLGFREAIRPPRAEKFRVLIAGGFGYGNTGDEAQLAASIGHWRRLLPDPEVIVLSPNPGYTQVAHGVTSEPAPRIVFFQSDKSPDYGQSNDAFKRRFFRVRRRMMLNARMLRAGLPLFGAYPCEGNLLELLRTADVLHLSGGGYLTGMTLSRLWDNMLLISLSQALGTPVVLSGHTIGVFKDKASRRLARWGLRKARLIYLRDTDGSMKDIESIGIRGPHLQATFDDALFCGQAGDAEVTRWLRRSGVDPQREYIVANFHHWGQDKEMAERATRRFAELCDFVSEKHRLQILFVPMHRVDERPEQMCLNRMKRAGLILDYDYDYRVTRGIMAGCTFCLTMKHHPIVFSLGSGTPAIAIALDDYYLRKNAGALSLFGLGAYALDKQAFFGARATQAIDDLLSNRDSIVAAIRRHLQRLKPRDGEAIARFVSDCSR
ncbi:MAG: polysaccharide pyruvyl transferase family protein, partial [Deltaproteobacteria bacterium]|nr:polysaccharide pyruvyl transferase family protein [Deltaproteobacteria bacterium]